ncbi:hypothetical protein [Crossiella sp. CA198]|uniref:hypothetical protein n=1 Tax=Crossiella sp. CA198 TaxID=3455607 RepID=UPI003F8D1ED5
MLPDVDLWATVRPQRTVLAVVRNLTSLVRLLDIVPLLDCDNRVAVHFTLDSGSVFTAGLHGQLDRFGITLLDWEVAAKSRFDLVLAAHVNPSLAALDGPLLVVPHGAGYNRRLPSRTNEKEAPVGLSPHELTVDGEVFPAVIGLSHQRQRGDLALHTPAAIDRARVIGDPTWDRIRAAEVRRPAYREALGVGPGQRLVLISSTWGERSLLGQRDELVERLLAQLPVDHYRVALVLHPNVWAYHGVGTVRAWFRDALDSGLLLIRPEDSWQAALIAADVSIGDHGSVAFYGAALGRPFLNSASGLDDLTPGSVTGRLVCTAPVLNVHGDLREQIERGTVSAELAEITADTLGLPGGSAATLRRTCYELLQLDPPAHPPRMLPISAPTPVRGAAITAFHVLDTVAESTVDIERFPAILQRFRRLCDTADYLLVIDDEEVDPGMRATAEIIVRTGPLPGAELAEWAARALAEGTAALVAAVSEHRCVLTFRDPALGVVSLWPCAAGPLPVFLAAVAVYRWRVSRRELESGVKLSARLTDGPVVEVCVESVRPLPQV